MLSSVVPQSMQAEVQQANVGSLGSDRLPYCGSWGFNC